LHPLPRGSQTSQSDTQWQLDFYDGDACAAALVSYFEFCHNGKLQHLQQSKTLNDELEKTPQGRTQVETLLQWHSQHDGCSATGGSLDI
jgi:hypothetical protein